MYVSYGTTFYVGVLRYSYVASGYALLHVWFKPMTVALFYG